MTAFVMCILRDPSLSVFFSSAITHILFKPNLRYWKVSTSMHKDITPCFLPLHLPCWFWTHSSYCCVFAAVLSCLCRLSHAAVATDSWSSFLSNDVTKRFLLFWHCWPILICTFQREHAGGLQSSGCGIVSHITVRLLFVFTLIRKQGWKMRNRTLLRRLMVLNAFLNSPYPSGQHHADWQ